MTSVTFLCTWSLRHLPMLKKPHLEFLRNAKLQTGWRGILVWGHEPISYVHEIWILINGGWVSFSRNGQPATFETNYCFWGKVMSNLVNGNLSEMGIRPFKWLAIQ